MGNTTSTKRNDSGPIPFAQEIQKLYESLCDSGILSQELFEKEFESPSVVVMKNLFGRFFIDLVNRESVTMALFIERTHWILERADKSKDEQLLFYLDLMIEDQSVVTEEDLKRVVVECQQFGLLQNGCQQCMAKSPCTEEDGCEQVTQDLSTQSLLADAIVASTLTCSSGSLKEKFLVWSEQNCPSIFQGLQNWLHKKFTGSPSKNGVEIISVPFQCEASSTQLGPSLLWFLCLLLPSCFTHMKNQFNVDEDGDEEEDDKVKQYTWNLLYDSNQHGLSLNRFKNKLLNYKSPTITMVTFSSGIQVVLAVDEAWQDSADKFGGPYCMLIEILPMLFIVEANSKMVYLKENGRSIPTGFVVGSESRAKLTISKDLQTAQLNYKKIFNEQVDRMEVWGCGGVEAIKTQADMKKWENKEIEKRKKVKLPGQWDQDKTILEMGGVTVNHSQRGDM